MGQGNVTIETIAKAYGVSCGTVSRALSRPEMVSPKTREKILATVREYHYIPNPVARAMSGSRGKTISIIVPDIEFSYQSELIRGCSEELYKHGYTLLVLDNSIYHRRTTDYISVLKQQICDGVIFCFENDGQSMRVIPPGLPMVSFEFPAEQEYAHSVLTDLDYACGELVSFLHVLNGHDKIGLVPGRNGDYITQQVVLHYRGALEKQGLPVREDYIYYCDWTLQHGYETIRYFQSIPDPPTCIIYYSDSLAQGALAACHEYRVQVPEELSIVTMDGARANRYLVPSVTTLNYDVADIGRVVANMMVSALNCQATYLNPYSIRASGIRTGGSVRNLRA